ncbi:MAG TPA: OstA-like protein [Prolixibacteraceae bacterium]|nr:OstA-like protein [Prolixibacteraceae bacterium]
MTPHFLDKYWLSAFIVRFGAFFILFSLAFNATSQEKKRVDILNADYLEADENIASNAQRLIGNVKIKHKDMLMWADSAYTYTGTNRVDAFGNVHINQGDTLDLYASKVYYNGDANFAQAIGNVRLINKSTTLYADTLDYDLERNIGYYDDFGKIVDSTNVLTSIIGRYLIDEDLIRFYQDVKGFNEDYTLESDTVFYYTKTGRMYILGPTTIKDSLNTLYAEDGWYNSETGEAELLKNPFVYNENQQLEADYIKYNEAEGDGRALGAVRIHDFENRMIVTGEKMVYNEINEKASVTDSALLIMYSETDADSLFLHADTLRTVPDTISGEKIVSAYYGVRFFRTDIQGIADSLVYFTKDSVVQLYTNPVIWSEIHQLSADYIEMKQRTNAPDELHLTKNSFIISKQDTGQFDQIKGKEMIGFIVSNKLRNIEVDGNGQTLYYAREEEEIIGLNRAESSKISILFQDGKIYRIAFRSKPIGELKPLLTLTEEEKRLSGFDWKVKLRPLTKKDVFNPPSQPEVSAVNEKFITK